MFCMVDRFSQIVKTSILSLSLLTVFSGVCYGQQNNGLTTRLISSPTRFNSTNTTFTGGGDPNIGGQSSVSGDGRTVAYSANNFKHPAIFRNPNVVNDQATFISPSLGGLPEEGLKTSQNMRGDMIAFTSSTISGDNRNNVYLFSGQNTVTLISKSLNSQASPANSDSDSPFISRDGRFIAFVSTASDITVDAPIDRTPNIYLFDGTSISLISRQSTGQAFSSPCSSPAVSENGTTIVFESNGKLFIKSSVNDVPKQIMTSGLVSSPTISADGKTIAFISNLPETGTVVVKDITNGTTNGSERVFPVRTANKPALSGNGTALAVDSSKDMTVDDNNGFRDVYVFSVQGGFTPTLVSVTDGGQNASGNSFAPSINDDGSVIAFSSNTNLTADSTISIPNVYARLSLNGGLGGGGVGSIQTGPVCIGRGRALTTDTIEISWGFGAHNDQLKGYQVEVMKLDGNQYKSLAKVPGDGKALYTDTGLTPNTVYTYRLYVSDPKGFAYTVDFTTKTKKVKKH